VNKLTFFSIDNSALINNIIMCHKCGYKNKSDSNFCNKCGNNLQIEIVDHFLEYQSPQYNFKINYPANWTMRDKYMPNNDMKVIFVSPSENSDDKYFESFHFNPKRSRKLYIK
jgi:hypothetical protein